MPSRSASCDMPASGRSGPAAGQHGVLMRHMSASELLPCQSSEDLLHSSGEWSIRSTNPAASRTDAPPSDSDPSSNATSPDTTHAPSSHRPSHLPPDDAPQARRQAWAAAPPRPPPPAATAGVEGGGRVPEFPAPPARPPLARGGPSQERARGPSQAGMEGIGVFAPHRAPSPMGRALPQGQGGPPQGQGGGSRAPSPGPGGGQRHASPSPQGQGGGMGGGGFAPTPPRLPPPPHVLAKAGVKLPVAGGAVGGAQGAAGDAAHWGMVRGALALQDVAMLPPPHLQQPLDPAPAHASASGVASVTGPDAAGAGGAGEDVGQGGESGWGEEGAQREGEEWEGSAWGVSSIGEGLSIGAGGAGRRPSYVGELPSVGVLGAGSGGAGLEEEEEDEGLASARDTARMAV
ncbi:hypothetical protein T484DRAFT_1897653 [Baffinella frigidus]|nr:hypothetical protein T484DRAFT_1897653 [Cryptophyta sp. CCMP2293]